MQCKYYKQHEPTLSMQVHNDGLYSVSVEPQGQMLTTGSVDGSIYLLELSRGLTELQRNEKSAVTQMFERESKREKNLEARAKELRISKAKEAKAERAAGIAASPVGQPRIEQVGVAGKAARPEETSGGFVEGLGIGHRMPSCHNSLGDCHHLPIESKQLSPHSTASVQPST